MNQSGTHNRHRGPKPQAASTPMPPRAASSTSMNASAALPSGRSRRRTTPTCRAIDLHRAAVAALGQRLAAYGARSRRRAPPDQQLPQHPLVQPARPDRTMDADAAPGRRTGAPPVRPQRTRARPAKGMIGTRRQARMALQQGSNTVIGLRAQVADAEIRLGPRDRDQDVRRGLIQHTQADAGKRAAPRTALATKLPTADGMHATVGQPVDALGQVGLPSSAPSSSDSTCAAPAAERRAPRR